MSRAGLKNPSYCRARLRHLDFLEATGVDFTFKGAVACGVAAGLLWAGSGRAAELPAPALQRLQAGETVDLLVEFEAAEVEAEAATQRKLVARRIDDAAVLALRADRYAAIRSRVDAGFDSRRFEPLRDYRQLPLALRRFSSAAAAQEYAAQPGVKAVFENARLYPVLAQSLPLVGQPAVAAAGENGAGTTVAVIDNGIKLANFGCTAAGVPAACRVVVAQKAGGATGGTGEHGSNVSGAVLGVAPGSRIAALDAFSGTSALTADVLAGIDWAIANRSAYNIVAINMSLGGTAKFTAPCGVSAFATPAANARAAGIAVVAAAGNSAYTNGMGEPACAPGIVSVGAVYDGALGSKAWTACTDATTAADKVACFSNSASFLTMLAPGSEITAGGYIASGTSQASPHVAGAVAVLRAVFPDETPAQTEARLSGKGTPVADARNGIVKPRLNLMEAARPANDAFAGALALGGASGAATGTNRLATRETGEPQHAGTVGGGSVWWRWTAPAAGQVTLDTQGSGFDTLLAVYAGTLVSGLQAVAANDNGSAAADGASSLLFQAQAGTEYRIAVDGAAGAAGAVALNWSLNAAASANLSLTLATVAAEAGTTTHLVRVSNAGPQTATGVVVTIALPAGTSYLSGTAGCAASAAQVVCAIGTLAAGTSAEVLIALAGPDEGSITLGAVVTSEVADPVAADNTQIVEVALAASGDGDVPLLPAWGMFVLASLLGGIVLRARAGPRN